MYKSNDFLRWERNLVGLVECRHVPIHRVILFHHKLSFSYLVNKFYIT
jgi:hypothetical protein